jgi:hypothetical protein
MHPINSKTQTLLRSRMIERNFCQALIQIKIVVNSKKKPQKTELMLDIL